MFLSVFALILNVNALIVLRYHPKEDQVLLNLGQAHRWWSVHGYQRPGGITIPNSVISIGEWAFDECRSLADVYTVTRKCPMELILLSAWWKPTKPTGTSIPISGRLWRWNLERICLVTWTVTARPTSISLSWFYRVFLCLRWKSNTSFEWCWNNNWARRCFFTSSWW